jgi:prevent-host-death family protein
VPRAVSTTEAKNRLSAMIGWVEDSGDEVIVEHHGQPRAVIMSFAEYQRIQALRERQRREQALAEIRALRAEVRARNQDLSDEEAMALTDRFVHEVVADMAEEGKLRFKRPIAE